MECAAPSVWVDDSHPVVRQGLVASLEAAGIRVRGESSRLQPRPPASAVDVLVFEAEHGGVSRAVRFAADADMGLVALLRRPAGALIAEAVNAGVSAVLLFPALTPASFVATVRGVMHGTVTLSQQVLPRLLDQAENGQRHRSGGLTDRERDVLALLAEGESTRAIAGRIAFSERTVKNLVHDVLLKMNCRNRSHAVAQATRQGII